MHTLALLAVEIPEVQEDEKMDEKISADINKMEKQYNSKKSVTLQILINKLSSCKYAFSRAVNSAVKDIMIPYCTSNPNYMEFEDHTEDLLKKYESVADCIRTPQGTIILPENHPLSGRFVIQDGKVFQKDSGPLYHLKRTKRAKKMAPILNYPIKKLYSTFEEYAESQALDYDQQSQRYGYYYNPNAIWDWYSIGGQWPDMFLVSKTCKEFSLGERNWCNMRIKYKAPDGYMWVCAARKQNIEWEIMSSWKKQKATEEFYRLKDMFTSGILKYEFKGKIMPDGIISYGRYVYRKEHTLEAWLDEYAMTKNLKYPGCTNDIIDKSQWLSKDDNIFDPNTGKLIPLDWHNILNEYIDNTHDDTVLVGVDYHI